MKFEQCDVVKVLQIRSEDALQLDQFNRHAPRVGDIASIIEIYDNPPGFELECSNEHGITEWQVGFKVDDIELELIQR